jgi:hypothetical protein
VEDRPKAKIRKEEVDIYFLEFTIIDTTRIYYRKISKKNVPPPSLWAPPNAHPKPFKEEPTSNL